MLKDGISFLINTKLSWWVCNLQLTFLSVNVKDVSTTKIFLKKESFFKNKKGFFNHTLFIFRIIIKSIPSWIFNRLKERGSNKKLKMQSSYQETGRRGLKAGEVQFKLSWWSKNLKYKCAKSAHKLKSQARDVATADVENTLSSSNSRIPTKQHSMPKSRENLQMQRSINNQERKMQREKWRKI